LVSTQLDSYFCIIEERVPPEGYHKRAETIRYNERSTVERVNGRLKEEFGGRMVRVRGHAKVMCHLMFGIWY
jgi:hypothetical protein